MADVTPSRKGQPSLAQVAFRGLCPKCAAPTLFDGLVRFAPRCPSCRLDFSSFNVGDGPAAFLTLIIGAIITGLAIVVELKFHPPFWVHVVLWVPLTVIGVVWGLRVAKAALLATEYQRRAGESIHRNP
ncbi:MAG: DUF983 domain-containing protein [Novosphingobium sp.]|nr:DUF983 domain-containing protein [Novosphingobium sp.]